MLVIRLCRAGSKNKPFYRVVVSESARTPRSRITEQIGYYDPKRKPEVVKIDVAKAETWMKKGGPRLRHGAPAARAGARSGSLLMDQRSKDPAAAPDIKAWVEAIGRDLVDRGDAVAVSSFEEDGVTVFELTVDPEELGRVIGRQGRTAEAIRTLLEVAGTRHGMYYDFEIVD